MTMMTLQSAFTSGELSPALSARVDFAKYSQGCKTLKNMLVQPQGGAVKRPGFLLLDAIPGEAVLLPFAFNNEQSYVLLFGEKWLRIATPEGFILWPDGTTFTIESPYTLAQAKKLSYAQSADVLFLACPDVRPHQLKRRQHNDWVFEPITFVAPIAPPVWDDTQSTTVYHERYDKDYPKGGTIYGLAYSRSQGGTSLPDDDIYTSINYDLYTKTVTPEVVTKYPLEFTNGAKDSEQKPSPAQLVTPYTYYITAIDEKDRESEASVGGQITGPSSNNWQGGDYITMRWKPVPGAVEYRVYKSQYYGRPGYIGSTKATSFQDYNAAPLISDGPPKWSDPFMVKNDAGVIEGDFPSVVCFFEQRLVFASTPKRPQTLWMSRTGDYDNFSTSTPYKADDSIELTIASSEVSRMCWMVALRSLVLGSTSMEWEISSMEGAFTAKTAKVTPQSYRGSAALRSLVIDNTIIHITRSGNEIRDFKYDFGSDSYAGTDRTILAEHLFEGQHILSWTYQSSPDSIIWAIRSDGVLLGMTFQAEHEVFAWHRHHTDGCFCSVCSIPSYYDDILFAVTQRDGKYFLEKMAHRYLGGDTSDCVFLDCATQFTSGTPVSQLSGLTHLEGKTVGILADGAVISPKLVKDGKISIGHPANKIVVGLPYTSDLETMPIEVVTKEGASVGRKKQITAFNIFFRDTITAQVGIEFSSNMETYKARTAEPYGSSPKARTDIKRFVVGRLPRNVVHACIRSDVPLPMTILDVSPEIKVS